MNDRGPAFPANVDDYMEVPDGYGGKKMEPRSAYGMAPHQGMSLRDYFAAHAPEEALILPSTLGDCATFIGVEKFDNTKHWPLVNAKARYIYADAMLQAREH